MKIILALFIITLLPMLCVYTTVRADGAPCFHPVRLHTVLEHAIFQDLTEAKVFAESKSNAKIYMAREDCYYVEWTVTEAEDSLIGCE